MLGSVVALLLVAVVGTVTGLTRHRTSGASAAETSRTAPSTTLLPSTTVAPSTTLPPSTTVPPAEPAAPGAPRPTVAVGPLDPRGGPIPVVHRIPTTDPVVFITIDDGIVRDPWALEALRVRGAPATLFLTSAYVTGAAPDWFRQFLDLGGSIESHTVNHRKLRGLPEEVQAGEICGPVAPYAEWFGWAPVMFRAPYGEADDATLRAAASCGMKAAIHWTAVVEDGVVSISGGRTFAPGDIILFHFQPDLAGNLSMVLDALALLGLRPANLREYLDAALAITPPPAPAPAPAPA